MLPPDPPDARREPGATLDDARLHRLLEVGRSLVSELDLDEVLRRVLDVARELTGARYAALGVLDDARTGLERFLTSGLDDAAVRRIGDPPHGHGVLGELIRTPAPLRLDEVSAHPRSYGYPPNHPPMSTFLGVPIVVRGGAWGNLYLTEKDAGSFTDGRRAGPARAGGLGRDRDPQRRPLSRPARAPRRAGADGRRPRGHDVDRPRARRRDGPRPRPGARDQARARARRGARDGHRPARRRAARRPRRRRRRHRRPAGPRPAASTGGW